MVILRRHNEKDCIRVMEDWWTEIKYGSKRDQLSFNYVGGKITPSLITWMVIHETMSILHEIQNHTKEISNG